MRHRKNIAKLGRPAAHRKALLRTLVDNLIIHGTIETTVVKAKELKRYTDNFLSKMRRNDLAAKRRAQRILRTKTAFQKIFTPEFMEFLNSRAGGYVRVLKTDYRAGDAAPLAIIELTGKFDAKSSEKPKAVKKAPAAKKETAEKKTVKKEAVKKEEKKDASPKEPAAGKKENTNTEKKE